MNTVRRCGCPRRISGRAAARLRSAETLVEFRATFVDAAHRRMCVGEARIERQRAFCRARAIVVGRAAREHLALRQRHRSPCACVIGIELDGALADADDRRLVPLVAHHAELPRHQEELVRLGVVGRALLECALLCRQQRESESRDDRLRDLVLQREDVVQVPVVSIRPDVRVVGGVDQLRRDAHAVAGLADAAFEHVRRLALARNLRHLQVLALEGKRGVARDDR